MLEGDRCRLCPGFPFRASKTCIPEPLHVRPSRNTRYGWVANPFPTGTFTPQDTPSFAWRTNVPDERLWKRPETRTMPNVRTRLHQQQPASIGARFQSTLNLAC